MTLAQAQFLSVVAYEATVWARSNYPQILLDTNVVIERLRSSNELQHRVTDQLAHLLAADPKRYPDDVFVAVLFDFARAAGCEERMSDIFEELSLAHLRKEANGVQLDPGAAGAARG